MGPRGPASVAVAAVALLSCVAFVSGVVILSAGTTPQEVDDAAAAQESIEAVGVGQAIGVRRCRQRRCGRRSCRS